jgi:hypothetical protein
MGALVTHGSFRLRSSGIRDAAHAISGHVFRRILRCPGVHCCFGIKRSLLKYQVVPVGRCEVLRLTAKSAACATAHGKY